MRTHSPFCAPVGFLRSMTLALRSFITPTYAGCMQALLRAGSVYGVLDLLGQSKKGAYFTRAEISTLHMLKRELLFWEEVFARGWQHVVSNRAQHEQRLLEKAATNGAMRPSPAPRRGEEENEGSLKGCASAGAQAPGVDRREVGDNVQDEELAREDSSTGSSGSSESRSGSHVADAHSMIAAGGESLLEQLAVRSGGRF